MFRTLLVDNYDSYTYNLYHQIAAVTSVPPIVVRNDRTTVSSVKELISTGQIHSIVVSPGPGTPAVAADVGVVPALFRELTDTPILGVCLGHQALAHVHGASVVRAPEPCHGRLSDIEHKGHKLFQGIPSGRDSGFRVVRYHSLIVEESELPPELQPICWTAGGHVALSIGQEERQHASAGDMLLMGIAHTSYPHYGIQYHPESVATNFGDTLLKNFAQLAAQHNKVPLPMHQFPAPLGNKEDASTSAGHPGKVASDAIQLQLVWRSVTAADVKCLALMETMGWTGSHDTFWLDSERSDRARFSILGGPGGRLWRRITFKLPPSASTTQAANLVQNQALYNGADEVVMQPGVGSEQVRCPEGVLTEVDATGTCTETRCRFRSWMKQFMEHHSLKKGAEQAELPFDFQGGLVGYLGDPDAAFFFADRFLVVDHQEGSIYVVAIHHEQPADSHAAEAWMTDAEDRIRQLQQSTGCSSGENAEAAAKLKKPEPPHGVTDFQLSRSKPEYIADIQACMEELYAGNSYEICLTNRLSGNVPASQAWQFYKCLRTVNAAPYSAWMDFGDENVVVCCSSPERFLKLDRQGVLEARPIKGTAARVLDDPQKDAAAAQQLAASEKDRAENLMIVDLLRNDLGCICEPCSVHVPGLMEVESFASVHQLVSTVRGTLKTTCAPVDALFEVFPGGSMTGAPKVRSMQIIDRLEGRPRGVYSGCLGYFSLNGTFDFNIVIRTAVFRKDSVSIGAGGAIVVQSDEVAEFEEMELKAERLLNAFRMLDSPIDV